jgi:hypothetical protein
MKKRNNVMAVIELVRKSKGGRSGGTKSDLRVYCTREKSRPGSKAKVRYSVGLRLSCAVMKRLRWILGDRVSAAFDDEAMTWTLRRVSDRSGNALSGQGRNRGDGTVRFAVEESQLDRFALDIGGGYDAVLAADDGDSAVFSAK